MIDFQWVVVLELCQGHFIVQQKWIISVFRFCCCLSELIRRKLLSTSSQFPGVSVLMGMHCCPICSLWPAVLLGRHNPQLTQLCAALGTGSLHCWVKTSASTIADFTLLKCFEKSVMPSLLLSLSFSSASSFLFYCAFSGFLLWFFLTNSQEHNASSLQSHSSWCWVLDERLKSQAMAASPASAGLHQQQLLQGHCRWGLLSYSSLKPFFSEFLFW